eukprot:TRINITY_DN8824_c0_g1_i1.p1 TRINITY_DN8824_c0_g1~~TRINITY_DN8824_c0_g1_i1.p1  ORF type:complete len:494 (+),score=89.32 TRINITY_DN8824_c0_g1_i1:133-1614(+)
MNGFSDLYAPRSPDLDQDENLSGDLEAPSGSQHYVDSKVISTPKKLFSFSFSPAHQQRSARSRGPTQRSLAKGIWTSVIVWIKIFARAVVMVSPVILLMALFFLPGLMLSESKVNSFRDLLYLDIGAAMITVFYYGFVCVYSIRLFGSLLCYRAIYFVVVPCLLLGIYLRVFLHAVQASDLVAGVAVVLYLETIRRTNDSALPHEPSFEYDVRKKQLLIPFLKMVIVLGGMYFALLLSFPVYLRVGVYGKLFLRFGFLPLTTSLCTGLQTTLMKGIAPRHLECAVPILWVSNGILKIWERLYTNSIFANDDYLSFALLSMFASVIEIVNHGTYLRKMVLVHKCMSFLSCANRKGRHVRRISSAADVDRGPTTTVIPESVRWVESIRRRMLVEDIAIELKMIITVTILLYLMHPLVHNTSFHGISSLAACVIQIAIQIFFEGISDVFGIHWAAKKHGIQIKHENIPLTDNWIPLWMVLLIWQMLAMFGWIILYS